MRAWIGVVLLAGAGAVAAGQPNLEDATPPPTNPVAGNCEQQGAMAAWAAMLHDAGRPFDAIFKDTEPEDYEGDGDMGARAAVDIAVWAYRKAEDWHPQFIHEWAKEHCRAEREAMLDPL